MSFSERASGVSSVSSSLEDGAYHSPTNTETIGNTHTLSSNRHADTPSLNLNTCEHAIAVTDPPSACSSRRTSIDGSQDIEEVRAALQDVKRERDSLKAELEDLMACAEIDRQSFRLLQEEHKRTQQALLAAQTTTNTTTTTTTTTSLQDEQETDNGHVQALEEECNGLQLQCRDLNLELSKKRVETAHLQELLVQHESEVNQLKAVIRERDIQLKLVQVESNELRRMNQEAEEGRMSLKQLLREKERDVIKQLSVISADRNRFEELVNDLQRQLQDVEEQNKQLENGRLDIDSDMQRVVVESNQKSVRIELLEEELGTCKTQLAELQIQVDDLNRLNSRIKDSNEMLQTQLDQSQAERAKLESTCESRHIPQEEELRLIKEKMEEMLDAHKKLNVELADITQERDEMLQSLKDHIQFGEEHENEREKLAEQIITKEKENGRLEIALNGAQSEIDRLQIELSSLRNRITENETVSTRTLSIPVSAATLPHDTILESGTELHESIPQDMEVAQPSELNVEPAAEMVVESSLTQAPPDFMPTQLRFDDDSIPLPSQSIPAPAESMVKSVQEQQVRRLEEAINDQFGPEPAAASTVEPVHLPETVSTSNVQSPSMIPARRTSNPESSYLDSSSELIAKLNERIEMLTREKEEIKDRIELEYSTRFAILRSEYAEDNSQLKQLNDETVRLETALKDSLTVAKQLREKLQNSEEQIRNLESVQARVEKEKEEFKEKADSDRVELIEDLRMTRAAVDQLTIELAAKSAAMQRIEQQHESDRKRFAELASQVTNSEVRLVEIEEERNQLFARLESERLTCEQLRNRVCTLETLETDVKDKINQIVELKNELTRLQTKANIAAEAVLVESGSEETDKGEPKLVDRVLIQETQDPEPAHVTANESTTGVSSDVNQDQSITLRQEIERLTVELNQARTDLQQGHVHKSNLDRTQEMLNRVTGELESLRQAFQVQQTETLQLRQLQNRLRDVTKSISCQTVFEQPTELVPVQPDSTANSTPDSNTTAVAVETVSSSRPFTSLDVALARTRNQNLLDDSPHTVMRKVGAAAQNQNQSQPLSVVAKPVESTNMPLDVSVKVEMQSNRSVQRKRQVVVAFTGFKSPNPTSPEYTEERKQELIRFVRELGGEVRLDASFDKQITHLVLPRSSRRSAKALAASLTGKWLVDSQWVTESFKANQFIAESPYGDRYFERPFENKKVALSAKFIKESSRRAGSSDFDRHALVRILVEKFGRGSLVSDDHADVDIHLVSTSELNSDSIQSSGQVMNFESFIDLIPGAPNHATGKSAKRKSQSADIGESVKRLKSEPSDPAVGVSDPTHM